MWKVVAWVSDAMCYAHVDTVSSWPALVRQAAVWDQEERSAECTQESGRAEWHQPAVQDHRHHAQRTLQGMVSMWNLALYSHTICSQLQNQPSCALSREKNKKVPAQQRIKGFKSSYNCQQVSYDSFESWIRLSCLECHSLAIGWRLCFTVCLSFPGDGYLCIYVALKDTSMV